MKVKGQEAFWDVQEKIMEIAQLISVMTLNLRKLMSISTQLTFEACRIISQSYRDHSYESFFKGPDDLVTDTDFKVQSMMIHGYQMNFPKLQIIGEQTQDFKGKIQYNYSSLDLDMLPSQSKIDQNLDVSQLCMWIDPLDCTRGFVKGNVEDVTVLVGISYNQKPIAGIIGTPFKLVGTEKVYDPVVTIGSVKELQAFDYTGKDWTKKQRVFPVNKPIKIATSNSRGTTMQGDLIRTLKADNVKAGGSGRKIIMVANGQADVMAYCQSWTHKWDSCAGDALIKAMGGRFTTPWGNNIRYDANRNNTHNKQGMLVSLDREVYEKCRDVMYGL